MWELDCEESWAPKNWCFWTVVLEKTLESPLDCREIQPVHSEGNQPWDFFGGTDAEAEAPVLWPPHVKSWLIGKDFDAGRDWGQEEKGTTEDEMAGWHHKLDVPGSEWTPGDGDGQGGLACCDSWVRRVGHDWATELNWTELAYMPIRWIIGSYARYMFNYFWRISRLFSIVIISIQIPIRSAAGLLFFPPLCQHLISLVLLFLFCFILIRVTYLIVLLVSISLMISYSDHLFMYWLSMYMSSLEKYLFRFSTHFKKILNKLLEIILDSHVILRNKI